MRRRFFGGIGADLVWWNSWLWDERDFFRFFFFACFLFCFVQNVQVLLLDMFQQI